VISEIHIKNFKSIRDLVLKPGRVTVLIGENGSGKSNILEAIAFAACAATNKLDKDGVFLSSRGVRVTEETWMKSAFPFGESGDDQVDLSLVNEIGFLIRNGESQDFECQVHPAYLDEGDFSGWEVVPAVKDAEIEQAIKAEPDILKHAERLFVGRSGSNAELKAEFERMVTRYWLQQQKIEKSFEAAAIKSGLAGFLIYAPENTVLRTPPPESAIQPLGIKGEGLFRLLQTFADAKHLDILSDLKQQLHLFGWFEDFVAPDDLAAADAKLSIKDRWLDAKKSFFDQRSANEGFLYVLFYLTLLMSSKTPKFFALDNIDNGLNPKLCSALIKQVAELAKKHGKQVICTTHNPAILDGLDLNDDEQRLFTVGRNSEGHTIVRRVKPPQPQPGEIPIRLSEAFVRGLVGGLPKHF